VLQNVQQHDGAKSFATWTKIVAVLLAIPEQHAGLRQPAQVPLRERVADVIPLVGNSLQEGDKDVLVSRHGAVIGTIWGTDIYTTDSQLAMAAVHAGAIKAGETGIVRVKIVRAPPIFTASRRNGVLSQPFGRYPAAYQVLKKEK